MQIGSTCSLSLFPPSSHNNGVTAVRQVSTRIKAGEEGGRPKEKKSELENETQTGTSNRKWKLLLRKEEEKEEIGKSVVDHILLCGSRRGRKKEGGEDDSLEEEEGSS